MQVYDMDIISAIIMIAIWGLIGSSIKKAKQRAQAARKPFTPSQVDEVVLSEVNAAKKASQTSSPDETVRAARLRFETAKAAYAAPMVEGNGADVRNKAHVAQPSFAPGAHAHEETSMSGFKSCPTEKRPKSKKTPVQTTVPAPAPAPAAAVSFTREETLRAIIYSEILARPKALR